MKQRLKQFLCQHPASRGCGCVSRAFVTHTTLMLRTATVAAAVWNLDQHLPLRENKLLTLLCILILSRF